MAIAADKGAVQADLTYLIGGHGSELGGKEVLLVDIVHVLEYTEDCQLYSVFSLIGIGHGADEYLHALPGDALFHSLFHLVGGQMGQQIGNDEFGLVRLPADGDVQHLSALERHHSVEFQGYGDPLVLLYTAVIVGAEIAHLVALIHRYLLQVQAGCVHMGSGNHGAVAQVIFAYHCKHKGLAPVVAVEFHARLELHARHIFPEAALLGHGYGVFHGLSLGAGIVEESHVVPAIVLQLQTLLRTNQVIAVLLLIKEFFSHIIHCSISP